MAEEPLIRLGKIEVYSTLGDITQIQSPAIMTAINSAGMWFGGVDGAIQRIAGNHYHSQVGAKMPLKDLQTIVAKQKGLKHRGKFEDVVFVVDDLKQSIDKVVYAGLETANIAGYDRILVPAIRLGVMAGVRESPQEAIEGIGRGIKKFAKTYEKDAKLRNILFVVYDERATLDNLSQGLKNCNRN